MASVKFDQKQRWGLLIAVTWTTGVVVLAIALHNLALMGFLGLNGALLFPFRKRKAAAGPVE